jgi:TonB family protein
MKNKSTLIVLSLLTLTGSLLTADPPSTVIAAPQAIEMEQPEVPVNYRRWGYTGEVVVTFQINEAGQPENIRLESYDDRICAKRVTSAVRQWRFEAPVAKGVIYRQKVKFG